jgi:hypothetical protein
VIAAKQSRNSIALTSLDQVVLVEPVDGVGQFGIEHLVARFEWWYRISSEELRDDLVCSWRHDERVDRSYAGTAAMVAGDGEACRGRVTSGDSALYVSIPRAIRVGRGPAVVLC